MSTLAQSRATTTAPTRPNPEPVSVPRKSRTGVARLRAQAVRPVVCSAAITEVCSPGETDGLRPWALRAEERGASGDRRPRRLRRRAQGLRTAADGPLRRLRLDRLPRLRRLRRHPGGPLPRLPGTAGGGDGDDLP